MSLLHVGLDIGSTTAKAVVLDEDDKIVHSRYCRHNADIRTTTDQLMREIKGYCDGSITMAVAGSGALGLAETMQIPFTQELVACSASVSRYLNGVDVAIELGGEDAKLTFFDQSGVDQRMNETCAGGTGAFLDQMAVLLGTDAAGLNELAKTHTTIYPIASRCGVFAKTDIQPLLNDGASKSDIAASIFQAIVNQTISGLACGRKITGNVAFLGGPLYFLSELRKRFIETLALREGQYIFPENPHLFVALGAAILGKKAHVSDMNQLYERALQFFATSKTRSENILPALFIDENAKKTFKERHSTGGGVSKASLDKYTGDTYLGIDVGSTTTKVVLIGDAGELLFSKYCASSNGEPVKTVRSVLCELFSLLPPSVEIKRCGVTGYGEKLVQAAFGIDVAEVETVAHSRAAEFVLPGADFVIDIGGQDMKCLGVHDGVIDRVFLNEACSSGCGSFLQSFAESLGMDVEEFAKVAEDSLMPVDLGSRCTVFMNSRVRQAQKEGASVADISAGLAYSVVKNALYKVLKIRSADELGERIVVQGGAFRNDALLRAFELITGREVTRPEISELMGAFGAALLARDRAREEGAGKTSLLSRSSVMSMNPVTSTMRCSGCGNRCILTRTVFDDGTQYVSGNRCERGGSSVAAQSQERSQNLFEKKYRRLFDHYEPLPAEFATRGTIGMPRVLNMYENYPFWFTFFTELGFSVRLSSEQPDEALGIDTIPSQTLCYPAKLAHRHLLELVQSGVDRIFFPVIQQESNEFKDAHRHFNCPVIAGYPDAAFWNIDELQSENLLFMRPALPMSLEKPTAGMAKRLAAELEKFGIGRGEINSALKKAAVEQTAFKADIALYGDEALREMKDNGGIGIVIAGHPYHLDPEVNHGIPELVASYGVTVFTEDSICGRADEIGGVEELYVVDQWVYHSRLYRAAEVVARHPDFKDVHLVQLNSFGCGLDAVSADQTAVLLQRHGKLHTLIKIDEGKNNGAVKIRIRSLLASIKKKKEPGVKKMQEPRVVHRTPKSTELRNRTILCPPLSSHHFQFLEIAMKDAGLDFRVLPEGGRDAVELGLKYVNNDACYPAMVVVGQFIKALESGEYDPETTDCLYAQTGGACRASNYVPLLRKALDAAGFENVRVLAANAQKNNGADKFEIPVRTVWKSLLGLMYGDMLMRLLLATRPGEKIAGSTERLYQKWVEKAGENVRAGSYEVYKRHLIDMVREFDAIPLVETPRPKVGIVGEILVKYHANSNERLVETIEAEGGEAVVPDLSNFMLYCLMDSVISNKLLEGKLSSKIFANIGISFLEKLRMPMKRALEGTRFGEIHGIKNLANKAECMVSLANQAGEGWLLTAEMMNLIESGVGNVICVQPFACLPNHITGKGVAKELKKRYPGANILALDYDSSVSNVNQMNRIKLLMATAKV